MNKNMKILTGLLLASLLVGVGDELIYDVLFGDVHETKNPCIYRCGRGLDSDQ